MESEILHAINILIMYRRSCLFIYLFIDNVKLRPSLLCASLNGTQYVTKTDSEHVPPC